jgi:integrase/recombinase XerD
MTISSTTEQFKSYLKNNRRTKSDRTLISYVNTIVLFIDVIGDKEISSLDNEDFIQFRSYLRGKSLSTSTIATYFSALIKYLDFLYFVYRAKPVESRDVMELRPQVQQKIPDALEKWEITDIIEAIEEKEYRFAVDLMFSTGVRISELLNLAKSDIKEKEVMIDGAPVKTKWLKIVGKGNKERVVPIMCKNIKQKLDDYMRYIDERFSGKRDKLFNFSYKTFWRKLKEASKKAGINISPHQLRHSFATEMYNKGADSSAIQQLMGHTSPATTARYKKVKNHKLVEAMRKFDTPHV